MNFRAILIALALSAASFSAQAQPTAAATGPGWTFDTTLYLWGAAMDGSVRAGELPKTSVDASFSDTLKHLEGGFMGAFEARNGRWGYIFDVIYMKLEASGAATRSGPGPIGATATANAELEITQTAYAAALAYRIGSPRQPLDVIGGVRYMKLAAEADIDASLFGQAGTTTRRASESWWDPYIGLRTQLPLAERWSVVAYADVGGFGVGSDFTWQALLGVDYEFSKTIVGKAGYRMLGVDYDKNGFAYDMFYSGLYLGAGFRF